MRDFRCTCNKIVFQIEGDTVIIKCRHCKRFIHIQTEGLIDVRFCLHDEVKHLQGKHLYVG